MNLIPKPGLTYLEEVKITHLGQTALVIESNRITLTPSCPDDRARLEAVFPANFKGTVVGRWETPISFVIGERLTLRTQAGHDQLKIEHSCPSDQQASYRVYWADGALQMVNVEDAATRPTSEQAEFNRVNAMPDPEIETLAAELGVEWDTKASRKTMVERVATASVKPDNAPKATKTKGK